MGTRLRTIKVDDHDWAILQGLAKMLVHDSEMPAGATVGAGRIPQLLRLIAAGTVVCYRPAPEPDPENNP